MKSSYYLYCQKTYFLNKYTIAIILVPIEHPVYAQWKYLFAGVLLNSKSVAATFIKPIEISRLLLVSAIFQLV